MAACDLGILGAAIGAGREYRDRGRAPGERSLSALVSSATLDPKRATREYRDEARAAARSCRWRDPFSARRLVARCRRFQLAAALVEECCAACTARCVTVPYTVGPGIRERRIGPDRGTGSPAASRRIDDRIGRREMAPA
jgi:hypothetical protein